MVVLDMLKEYIDREDWIGARAFIEEKGLASSLNIEVLERVGLVYFKLYHFNMAEKIFKELKKLDPENVNCHI